MNSLVARIAEDAAAPIERAGANLLIKVGLFVLALASFVASAIVLTVALYEVAERWWGSLDALVCVGGLYLIFAIVLSSTATLWGRGSNRSRTETSPGQAEGKPTARDASGQPRDTETQPPDMAGAIDRATTPLLGLLREHGMERERLAVAAAATVAKELHPWTIVGLFLVLGMVVGHFARSRPTP